MSEVYYAPSYRSFDGGRRPTQGLYVLSIPGNYWKVGIAFDVADRVRQLQCGCPEKISVEVFFGTEEHGVSAYRIERELHLKMAAHRSHGEWFNLPEKTISYFLKEAWFQLKYPVVYERLERFRAYMRATRYRRQKDK